VKPSFFVRGRVLSRALPICSGEKSSKLICDSSNSACSEPDSAGRLQVYRATAHDNMVDSLATSMTGRR